LRLPALSNNGHHDFVPTDEQRLAIEHVQGPMLVVAGAGTGKTTVLARRIAHLIQSEAARPDEILAVTYTRNSAAELIARVAAILYPKQQASLYPDMDRQQSARRLLKSGLQAHTFHGYCYKLLREAGTKFDLLDDKDLFVFLRRQVGEMNLQHYIKAAAPGKFLDDLLKFFSSCHDELRTPEDYADYVAKLERHELPLPRMAKRKDAEAMPEGEVLARCHEVAGAFRFTEELLKKEGLGTFGHIMTRAVDLLTRRKSVLERERRHARFILIDEFQDSNVAQIRLAGLLAGDEANVFAVGDPDQAIYQFRGATSGAFDQFLQAFGSERVKRVTMSANRRSTPPILKCAYQAIRCNPDIVRVDANWTRRPLSCDRLQREPELTTAAPVQAVSYGDLEQEAPFIADNIEAMRREDPALAYRQIAVLYRSHYHREKIVEELTLRGIPVRVKGADLFQTPELRDAMAALRILDSSHPVALFRVAALEKFHVDGEHFRAELALCGEGMSAEAALEKIPAGREVVETIRGARNELIAEGNALSAAMDIVQRDFGLPESMPLRRLRDFSERWCNKPKQVSGEKTLHEFLEYVATFCNEAGGALLEENDEDDPVAALEPTDLRDETGQDAVQLMTIHAAKGLEFRRVFVIRVASQSLPSNYKESLVEFPAEMRTACVRDDDPKTRHNEEERRLFYVAMTRAMDELYLCGKAGKDKQQPVPPTKYMRELVYAAAAVDGAIEWRLLPVPQILQICAGAEEAPLTVSQWTRLAPRDDARLLELSASALQTYESCPLRYKLRYDWKLPEDTSAAPQFGNAMHLALKAYFDGLRAGRPPDEQTVIACFLDEFAKASIPEPLQREMYEKNGRDQLASFLRSELARPAGKVLHTEKRFSIEIGGARVRGRLDRLDDLGGEVGVIDYKTGRAKTQDDADDSLQLSIYALAAKSLGHHASKLVFVNLQNGAAVESQRSDKQLRDAESLVQDIAQKIAAGEFDPKPGAVCAWCSYHSICPEREQPLPRPAKRAVGIH
jgi:DNA helicase II / ATP-dependent DNA helicase PcrA